MAVIGNLYKTEKFLNRSDLKAVFDYLKEAATAGTKVNDRIFQLPVGAFEKIEIANGVFALEQVFNTKERNLCFFESHHKYIDFQLNLGGIEQMEHIDIDKLTIKRPYDEKKDLVLYEFTEEANKLVMQKDDLSIYFPEDGHMGLPMYGGSSSLVHKTVVKFENRLF